MGDPVLWFELGAGDPQPLVSFYGELLRWSMRPIDGGYTLVDTRGGSGVNGGIGRSESGTAWVTFYVAVDDPQAALDRIEALGGRTVVPVTEVPQTVTYALFEDPDGLLVGLMKQEEPQEGQAQGPSAGDGAAVDWFEV